MLHKSGLPAQQLLASSSSQNKQKVKGFSEAAQASFELVTRLRSKSRNICVNFGFSNIADADADEVGQVKLDCSSS